MVRRSACADHFQTAFMTATRRGISSTILLAALGVSAPVIRRKTSLFSKVPSQCILDSHLSNMRFEKVEHRTFLSLTFVVNSKDNLITSASVRKKREIVAREV